MIRGAALPQPLRALLCTVLLLVCASTAHARSVVIHAGVLIDDAAKPPRARMSIIVTDERITGIETGFVPPGPGAELVDLSDFTVLPGLIDTHVHLGFGIQPGDPIRALVTRNDFDDLLVATTHARDTLRAGFSSVRDVAAWNTDMIVALKRAIDSGALEGPRLWVSGVALGPTGGPGDFIAGLRSELSAVPSWREGLVDSPDEGRRKVRALHRSGADLIKLFPSGGVASIGSDPALQLMADDEIQAAVEAAHALKMKVAAHAHGRNAILSAVRLGADSIEHGTYGDAETDQLMKASGTFLVPTLLVAEKIYQTAKSSPETMLPSSAQKALTIAPLMTGNLRRAHRNGVRIAFGSDTFGYSRHGENAQEFALMVAAGLTPRDALISATRNAAELIGAADRIGTIAPGKFADVIAVSGNPLTDVTRLEHVAFVMKGGAIARPLSATGPQ